MNALRARVTAPLRRRAGPAHPECRSPSVHNPHFAVNVSPVPLIVVRRISPHDVRFTTEQHHFAAYREHFGNCTKKAGPLPSPPGPTATTPQPGSHARADSSGPLPLG
ncbi:DUF6875 domain-containing protein [Streptomyces sp. NPDC055287]